MAPVKVKSSEKRQDGFLYFVKGKDLTVYKVKMARGGKKKKKKAAKKKVVKKKTTKKKAKKKRR